MGALAWSVGALFVVFLGVGLYRVWPGDEWILWTGFGVSAVLAVVSFVRAIRLVRQREADRGLPITALVLSATILTVEVGLTVIVLALTYAFKDFTF
jgi:hypothetical protein